MPKCGECGFVCVRNNHTQEEVEVKQYWRVSGGVPSVYGCVPYCFVRAIPIEEEMKVSTGEQGRFVEILKNDRSCSQFVQWRPGWTPREHQEMLDSQAMRQWQEEQRERDRQWQERQQEKDRQWRKEQEELSARRDQERRAEDRGWQNLQAKRNRSWQLKAGLIVAFFAGLIGLLNLWVGTQLTSKAPAPATLIVPEKPTQPKQP